MLPRIFGGRILRPNAETVAGFQRAPGWLYDRGRFPIDNFFLARSPFGIPSAKISSESVDERGIGQVLDRSVIWKEKRMTGLSGKHIFIS
jgi:hypothetical protein